MKYILLLLTLFTNNLASGQISIPSFLQGTWKIENKEHFEHWDQLDNQTLRGFAYKLENGQMKVSEYLDISERDKTILYTATVLNQNNGKGVEFKLIRADSIVIFENPVHDFPKKISYQKLSNNEIFVQVSDGKQKTFSYKMKKQNSNDTTVANPDYDNILADKLGGDEYGMKSYFLVILKTGANTTTDEKLITESFRGHMSNMNKMVEDGKLIIAGPLGKNKDNFRGIFILDKVESIEEAKELLQTDPAIQNELLDYDIFNWYGSAALPEYLPFSDKIWRSKP